MRCFVACFVAPDAAERLRAACPRQPDMRWIAPTNYHVTLHFLGEIDESARAEMLSLIDTLDAHSTVATLEEFSGFPKPSRARVMVALVGVAPELLAWHAHLKTRWPTRDSTSRFVPHVSLARSRTPRRIPEVRASSELSLPLGPPRLYQSVTLPDGPSYQPVTA